MHNIQIGITLALQLYNPMFNTCYNTSFVRPRLVCIFFFLMSWFLPSILHKIDWLDPTVCVCMNLIGTYDCEILHKGNNLMIIKQHTESYFGFIDIIQRKYISGQHCYGAFWYFILNTSSFILCWCRLCNSFFNSVMTIPNSYTDCKTLTAKACHARLLLIKQSLILQSKFRWMWRFIYIFIF